MKNGFIKVCAATPDLKVANTAYNVNECVKLAEAANEEGAKLIVFPKLTITGASCGDLFYSEKLISEAKLNITEHFETEHAHIIVSKKSQTA